MNPTELANNRVVSTSETAQERFAESSRSASFSMNLGVREVRLLGENNWKRFHAFTTQELAAYHKLLDKGLIVREPDRLPELSEAGELMRRLLVHSKHIVLPEKAYKASDILEQIQHAVSWYGSNGMTAGSSLHSRIDKDADREITGLIIKTVTPDCDKYQQPGYEHLRPKIATEYHIQIEKMKQIG